VALSFVRRPDEMEDLRRRVRRAGHAAGLIAKIEKPEAVDHLDAILRASDGVMVARGDLGVELSPEQVPPLQKRIIAAANRADRLVITATQMLQSMMDSPVPTRAEASDVANAIFDGSDAVMLSGETASGKYPRQAARTMARIIRQAETSPQYNRLTATAPVLGPDDALVESAVDLAAGIRARALVVFTQTGATARLAARRRPATPQVVFAHDERVARRLALAWGVHALVIGTQTDTEALLAAVDRELRDRRLARPGETVVVIASSPVARRSHVNFLKVQTIGRGPQ
jgi:pyruvate kinase